MKLASFQAQGKDRFGFVAEGGLIDLSGRLAGRCADLAELLKVDADGWKAAIPQIEQHFAQFGDALPAALADQLRTLANSL